MSPDGNFSTSARTGYVNMFNFDLYTAAQGAFIQQLIVFSLMFGIRIYWVLSNNKASTAQNAPKIDNQSTDSKF